MNLIKRGYNINMHSDVIIEIHNDQDRMDITQEIKNIISKCVNKTLDMEGFELKVNVCITLVDNLRIEAVNLEYRGVDRATDVLSFPMLDLRVGQRNLVLDEFINDIDPESGAVILGDIVISMEKVVEQAEEYGHSFERELGFLVVHGLLHLLGYDHTEREDRDIMRSREEAILGALDLVR